MGYLLFLLLGGFAACLSHLVLLAFIFQFRWIPYLTWWLFHSYLSIFFFLKEKMLVITSEQFIFLAKFCDNELNGKIVAWAFQLLNGKIFCGWAIQFIHKRLWEKMINLSMFRIINFVILHDMEMWFDLYD